MNSAVAEPDQLISVEEYLEGERFSEIRHEYVGGYVYAMAGASDDHNRIAGNIFSTLQQHLRGKRCEPFGSDMKFRTANEVFYYPDVMVACDPTDNAKYFRERPTVVFEVLSPETERTDQREKYLAYALVPSLKVYVMVSQEKCEVTVLRRGQPGHWSAKVVRSRDSTLKLPEIKAEIPLVSIYKRTRVAKPRA